MKDIAAAFAQMGQQQISDIEKSDAYTLSLASGDVLLDKEDYSISSEDMPGWLVASDSDLTVALDITVTDQLRREGIARELINRIQNLRKDNGFEVTDRIRLTVEDLPEVRDALQDFRQYVCEQTLAVSLDFGKGFGGSEVEWDEAIIELKAEKA